MHELRERTTSWGRMDLPHNAFLPMEGQVRAQKALLERWKKTELGL